MLKDVTSMVSSNSICIAPVSALKLKLINNGMVLSGVHSLTNNDELLAIPDTLLPNGSRAAISDIDRYVVFGLIAKSVISFK